MDTTENTALAVVRKYFEPSGSDEEYMRARDAWQTLDMHLSHGNVLPTAWVFARKY